MMKRLVAILGECLLMLLLFSAVTFLLYEFYFSGAYYRSHIFYRFFRYIGDILTLDFGTRPDGVRVSFFIIPALSNSFVLLLPPVFFAVITAYGVSRRQFVRKGDRATTLVHGAAKVITSVPLYWLGFILLGISMTTRWFPIGGVSSPGFEQLSTVGQFLNRLRHLFLPYVCLYLFSAVVITTMVQDRVSELSGKPYVITALSQGLSRAALFKKILSRPAWAEALLQAGVSMPVFISMMVIIERVFLYPGLGTLAVEPYGRVSFISTADSRTAQAAVVCIGICSILLQYLFRSAVDLLLPGGGSGSKKRAAPSWRSPRVHFIFLLLVVPLISLIPGIKGGFDPGRFFLIPASILFLFGAALLLRGGTPDRFKHNSSGISKMVLENEGTEEMGSRRPLLKLPADPLTIISVGVFLVILVGAWLVPEGAASAAPIRRPLTAPSWWESLWMPGSIVGRSILAARFLVIPVAASIIGGILGAVAGTASGISRGRLLDPAVRFLEVFPSVLIYIFVSSLFDGHPWAMMLPLGVIASIRMYQVVRFEVTRIMGLEYIQYARLLGSGFWTLLYRHLLPNLLHRFRLNLIEITIDMIILEANVSFIGRLFRSEGLIASRIPILGWGPLFRDARHFFIRSQWDQVFIPALVFSLVILSLRVFSSRINRRAG